MSFQITAPILGQHYSQAQFSTHSFDLHALGEADSPFIMLDDFRVRGTPFPPHPHAGFSAVTYVFEDSASGLRVRDSIGNDLRVQPGGIVWTQAGQGVIHQEGSSDARQELHGVQIFVNLSAQYKLLPPQTFWLDGPDVPQWTNNAGDRVRVLAGQFGSCMSPLKLAEEITLLDMFLSDEVKLPCRLGQYALVYVVSGLIHLSESKADKGRVITAGQSACFQIDGSVCIEAITESHLLCMVGDRLRESLVISGPFVMNSRPQISEALTRLKFGQFGSLAPLSEDV